MTKRAKTPPLISKVAITLGITMLIFTPFWFQVGANLDSAGFGIAGVFYGWCSAVVWLLVCIGVLAFGVLRYTNTRK